MVEVEDALPCEDQTLPGTGGDYCIKANPDCLDEGASCPLYVFDNFDGDRLFERVEQPERYGPIIVVRAKSSGRDFYAELPRVIAQTHPGLDQQRIYAMGFSVGSAHLYEALTTGDFDSSPYGTTSDLYAAVANLGGCMKISDDYETIPNFHLIMINGAEDPFGNNGCDMPEAGKDWARKWAVANDCDDPQADWAPVEADDPLMAGGDGTDKAVKLAFGACEAGDIVAYRFRDEEHELSFDLNFDDKVHAVEIAWDFLSGRRKEGGLRGVGSACRP